MALSSQSHLPAHTKHKEQDPYSERGEKVIFRFCLERIRVAFSKANSPGSESYYRRIQHDADIRYNHEIYDEFIEIADNWCGIAFENMADIDGRRRFGTTREEISSD